MNFTPQQEQVILTNQSHVLVKASAAAGKTAVLAERLQYLINSGEPQEQIVAITYTNNAVSELRSRLHGGESIFIGTVHSYCNFLLMSHGVNTSELLDQEKFDELFELIKKHPYCRQHVKHLLVDEAQDSTPAQFDFFFNHIAPDNYMLFYDLRQHIYGFAGADPTTLIEKENEDDIVIYEMNKNFRNGSSILSFARNLIGKLGPDFYDNSYPCVPWMGRVHDTKMSKNEVVEMLTKENPKTYGSWFILCRTNGDVEQFIMKLEANKIPCLTFKQGDYTNEEIKSKLTENAIKVLTIHSAKGLESDNVVVWNPQPYNDEERRICYVAATRARRQLWWIHPKVQKKKKKKEYIDWE